MNSWVEHVKQWAKANGQSYGCAISKPACKESYRLAKMGVSGGSKTPSATSTRALRDMKAKMLGKKPK